MQIKSLVVTNKYDDFIKCFDALFEVIEFLTTYDIERLNEKSFNIYVDDLVDQNEAKEDLQAWQNQLEELCNRINKLVPITWLFE